MILLLPNTQLNRVCMNVEWEEKPSDLNVMAVKEETANWEEMLSIFH